MSVVHVAIAWLALEKSVHIYTVAAVFFIWFTQTISRKQEKQTCAFVKVQRKDPQLVVTTVNVNGFT